MSYPCCYHFHDKRYRHGAVLHHGTGGVQHPDLAFEKVYTEYGEDPGVYIVIDRSCYDSAVCAQGFVPALYSSLGIYIPLIVVNCIILGRAEAYASKNGVLPSIFDGIGMGLGFTMALAILGFLRELIGNGTILSDGANALVKIPEEIYTPASIMILAPGAFIVLAFVIAAMNKIKEKHGMKPAEVPDYTTKEGCAGCAARYPSRLCAGAAA